MAQNYYDRDATSSMNADFSNYMSTLPKTSLEGFSIPRLKKSELQNKLINMAMPSVEDSEIKPNVTGETTKEQTWSSAARPLVKSEKKKRTFQEMSGSKSWAESYDKPIPKSILDLCLDNECKICGVQILNFLLRRDHYEGSKHEKKVRLELNELYGKGEESPPKKRKVGVSADMFLKMMESQVSRETSNQTTRADYSDHKVEEWQKEWDRPLPPPILAMCRIEKCNICEATFNSVVHAQQHFEGKNHEKKLKVCLEAFCQQNGIATPKRVASTESLDEKFCELCDVELSSAVMARIHYQGKQHEKRKITGLVKYDKTGRFGIGREFQNGKVKEDVIDGAPFSYPGDDLKEVLTAAAANEEEMDGTWADIKLKEKQTNIKLEEDQIDFKLRELREASIKLEEQQTFKSEVSPNVSFSYPIKSFNPFFCQLCNLDLQSQVVYDSHIKGKNHKKKEKSINQTEGEFFCDVCNLQLTAQVIFEAHIRGKQHAKKVGSAENPKGAFHCDVCNISTSDQNGLTMHLNGKSHQSKLRQINGSV